jgi:hypothetical protein
MLSIVYPLYNKTPSSVRMNIEYHGIARSEKAHFTYHHQ